MTATTEDDIDTMPETELLALPEQALPGGLSRLSALRANAMHDRAFNEMILELTGDSARHLMISRDQDPKEKRRREEEKRRRTWLAYEESMREFRERSESLLAQIEIRQREIETRRQEIEDNALRLHNGRRVFVDGDGYRDEEGRVLAGADADEARDRHREKPGASTWQERQKAKESADELERLHQKVLMERQQAEQGGQGLDAEDLERQRREAEQRMTGYEKEFSQKVETAKSKISAETPDDVAASYSTDFGGDGSADTGRSTSYAKTQDGAGKMLASDFAPAAKGTIDPDKPAAHAISRQGGPKAQA